MFDFKEIYQDGDIKILEVNILSEKYCNFDCVFCPIGGATFKSDQIQHFGNAIQSYKQIIKIIDENEVDWIYFNSNGESLIHEKFEDMVKQMKFRGLKVRLSSNGYMLGMPEYMKAALKCDEVIGEILCTSEESFQKYLRPLESYSLRKYVSNMVAFSKIFQGKFTIVAKILKGINDDQNSIQWLFETINQIRPDEILVETLTDNKRGTIFGIDESILSVASDRIIGQLKAIGSYKNETMAAENRA